MEDTGSSNSEGASDAWRVRAEQTVSGWSWDVAALQLRGLGDSVLRPKSALCSASVSDDGRILGYEAHQAVRGDGIWGGRRDAAGQFWVGAEFSHPVLVDSVRLKEPHEKHSAIRVVLERRMVEDWEVVRELRNEEREQPDEVYDPVRTPGSPPGDGELVVPPSRPLTGCVHDVCYVSKLHDAREFQPDPEFYLAEDCEGLWVCASRACGPEVLARACNLVRSVIPAEQRALWARFRSPRWAKDPGPMRIVILDDRTNEQAGQIPELQDGSGGRNGTSCPFVFTSREDFDGGIARSWKEMRLTAHEMTHGADMVLRQLHDPSFHEEAEEVYLTYRDRFWFDDPQATGRPRWRKCYAAANRDEFLAEVLTILLGLHENNQDYIRAGLSTPAALEEQCPGAAALVRKYFHIP